MQFVFALLALILIPALHSKEQDSSRQRIEQILVGARIMQLHQWAPGDGLVALARQLEGAPYVAGWLDKAEKETLAVDLDALDCVTFVETALALFATVQARLTDYESFLEQLRLIRYRQGIIGYATRLHYTSDWLNEAYAAKRLYPVWTGPPALPITKPIHFMTDHRARLPKLKNKAHFDALTAVEKSLSRHERHYIPAGVADQIMKEICHGDIVCFCSKKNGLDFEHLGIAVVEQGEVHLLHASQQIGQVWLTPETLSRYLETHRQFAGIEVWRLTPTTK